jgi:hypothetical protein
MRIVLFWVINAARSAKFSPTFRDNISVLSSWVKNPNPNPFGLLDLFRFLPLKIGPIGCPETSVRNYHYSLRNNSAERSSHLPLGGSLKSRIYLMNIKLYLTFKEVHVFDVAIQMLSY